jgi:hypothetical protein
LKGQALAALGGALIHATRGRDEEGSILLHEAIELAWQTGDRPTAVAAIGSWVSSRYRRAGAIPLKRPSVKLRYTPRLTKSWRQSSASAE